MSLRALTSRPWAILPEKLEQLATIYHRHAEGWRLSAEEIDALRVTAQERVERSEQQSTTTVAVIPVLGVISQRPDMMTSGGTSTQRVSRQLRSALADPGIDAIVFDVDSPGGEVSGLEELSAEIFAARGQKPMLAVSNALMASAAYYIASAADEVSVTPSGEVGSIGVIAVHMDMSPDQSRKFTVIRSGENKGEGNPFEPLPDTVRARIQDVVDQFDGMFVRAVARNRGITPAAVRSTYGAGRLFTAAEARKLKMVDRIETIEHGVSRLMDRVAVRKGRRGTGASADGIPFGCSTHEHRHETHEDAAACDAALAIRDRDYRNRRKRYVSALALR